jgi:hypothetical protein
MGSRQSKLSCAIAVWFLLAGAPSLQAGPLPLPESQVKERCARVDRQSHPGAEAVVVYKGTRVTVKESGTSTREEQVVVKLLTPLGVGNHTTLRFDYDPSTSDIEVKRVTVLRADGSVEQVGTERVVDLPAPKHGLYWPFRMKLLNVPALVPGDAVVWETAFTGFQIAYLADEEERFIPPQKGEFYDIVLFGGENPVVEQEYELLLPPGKPVQYAVFNGEVEAKVTETSDPKSYRFSRRDIPPCPAEDKGLQASDALTKVILVTLPGWPAKSRWFYLTNEPSFLWSPEIEAKAREIVKGIPDERSKATALNRWVAHYVRYSGLSMGRAEGYTIHPGTVTFQERCGVCKDKAGMLVTMMRAIGLSETFAAMTMAGARVEDLPAEQFNHAVVAWRQKGGGFILLDPTWSPLSAEDWSSAEAEQHYVIGTPQGEELEITPELKPDDNRLVVKLDSVLDQAGNLTGAMRISGTGFLDTVLRRIFGFAPRYEWRRLLEGMLRGLPANLRLEPSRPAPAEVEDLDQPFEIALRFAAARFAALEPGPVPLRPAALRLFLSDPRLTENLVAGAAGRKKGLFFRCAKEVRYEETLALPEELKLVGWQDVSVANDTGSVEAKVAVRGRKLTATVVLRFPKRSIAPAELSEYGDLMSGIEKIRAARVVLERGR